MIDVIFQLANEIQIIRIIGGKAIQFTHAEVNYRQWFPADNLILKKEGIIKTFPDLARKSDEEMRKIAIQRLKNHIAELNDEEKIKNYLIKELKPYGYEFKKYRRII